MRPSRRTAWTIAAIALLLLALFFTWRAIAHPPRPWLVRWHLNRYLAKQAKTSDFKANFPFPSKAEMRAVEPARVLTKGPRTGREFNSLREEYLTNKLAVLAMQARVEQAEQSLAKLKQSGASADTNRQAELEKVLAQKPDVAQREQSLEVIESDLWEFQRNMRETSTAEEGDALASARAEFIEQAEQELRSAPTYDAMYRVIGRELFVAGKLLESENTAHRRQGVLIALSAARDALNHAVNGYVAARICEGYVLPNLDLATDPNANSTFNHESMLRRCAEIFRQNEEPQNVVRTYEMYLEKVKSPAQADWARLQIALTHQQAGNYQEALEAVRKIANTNAYARVIRRIEADARE